jgi:hypothetical protein
MLDLDQNGVTGLAHFPPGVAPADDIQPPIAAATATGGMPVREATSISVQSNIELAQKVEVQVVRRQAPPLQTPEPKDDRSGDVAYQISEMLHIPTAEQREAERLSKAMIFSDLYCLDSGIKVIEPPPLRFTIDRAMQKVNDPVYERLQELQRMAATPPKFDLPPECGVAEYCPKTGKVLMFHMTHKQRECFTAYLRELYKLKDYGEQIDLCHLTCIPINVYGEETMKQPKTVGRGFWVVLIVVAICATVGVFTFR